MRSKAVIRVSRNTGKPLSNAHSKTVPTVSSSIQYALVQPAHKHRSMAQVMRSHTLP